MKTNVLITTLVIILTLVAFGFLAVPKAAESGSDSGAAQYQTFGNC